MTLKRNTCWLVMIGFLWPITEAFVRLSGSSISNPSRHSIFTRKESHETLLYQGNNHGDSEFFSFEEMEKLERRLDSLEEVLPDYLMDFYEPHLYGFSILPGKSGDRMSITSTCYAIRAMLASDSIRTEYKQIDAKKMVKELIKSPWREEDLYQVALILMILLKVDDDTQQHQQQSLLSSFDEDSVQQVGKFISLVLRARPRRRYNEQQTFSDYITYLCASVYASLFDRTAYINDNGQDKEMLKEMLPEESASEISLALLRASEISFNELCRQMAYHSAKESGLFDTTRLAYSLLTYIRSTQSLEGTAGREAVSGQGPDDTTKPPKQNRKIIQAALDVFMNQQQPSDGLWERGQPIYKNFRRQGRNVGNAYVFSIDTVANLLEILPAEDFRPHLPILQNMLEWLETNQAVEIIPDYCDPESGQCYGKPIRGWSSPHLSPVTGPQAWATAQAAACLYRLKMVVQQLMHNDVLEQFNGISHSQKGPRPAAWDRLLDSDLGGGSGRECRTLKSVLDERICIPFESSMKDPTIGAVYSCILFGSPGTAKTTISEAVAEKMGYDFVVFDTAAFLADGLTNVASRIRYVFTRLQALRQCVILFDEIEEFCLDREMPGISMESRMLTTAMLTAINDLRRKKQSVFFLATNRLRAFDAAIIRPGRFDIQLFVGTPNLHSRKLLLEQALASSTSVSSETKQAGMKVYQDFLESVWSVDGDAMFMNYLEGKQFATSVASLIVSKAGSDSMLEVEELQILLDQQAAVMTCRGAVRDEYKAQMELSRL